MTSTEEQDCGVARNRSFFLGGVEFLTTLGVGVGFFVGLRLGKSDRIIFLLHTP